MANQLGGPAGPTPSTAPPNRNADPRGSVAPTGSGRRAVVGAASALRGQLSAREDVWIDGQLEGEVQAPAHQVTIGAGGRVRADVRARAVVVEGELIGNVVASEMVTVRAGGRVVGDVRSPRVVLEDGCQFQGNVDMDSSPSGGAADTSTPEPAATSTAANPAASEPTTEAVAAPAPAPAPATVGEGSR